MQPSLDLGGVSGLEEKLHRLDQVGTGALHRVPLARDVQLRTERDVAVALTFDDRRELSLLIHHESSEGTCSTTSSHPGYWRSGGGCDPPGADRGSL